MSSPAFQAMKRAGRLPSPKGVALELMRLLDAPKSDIKQIVSIVEADPVISSRLLKLVNSPLAGVSRTVASLSTAVNLLGRPTVRNLVLGMSLIDTDGEKPTGKFSFEVFWSESLARAVSARHLAHCLDSFAPDEAFTVALVSDIGSLALAFTYPERFDQHLEVTKNKTTADRLEAERETFSIDHNDLSAEMMAAWHLPELFCESVRNQDTANAVISIEGQATAESRGRQMISLLQLAGAFASTFVKDGIYHEDLTELLSVGASFGISSNTLSEAFDGAKDEWHDLGRVFSVQSNDEIPSLSEAHSRASRDQRQILVVDDNPVILHVLTKQLTSAGYMVHTARDGNEALRAVLTEGFQLIITDWNMPGMDGTHLCQALRDTEGVGHIYIVVVTGQTDLKTLEKAFDSGADDFLIKPWQPPELLARLKAGVRTLRLEARIAAEQRTVHRTNAELAVLNDRLGKMAITDELTGLHNRREATSRMLEYWAMAKRKGEPLACMALDIDFFKRCNDNYGHDVGDFVLRETSRILQRVVRTSESVFRMGGEEFLVLCPSANASMAAEGAERIRKAIEAHRISHQGLELQVTISAGVAQIDDSMVDGEALLKMADEALYQAKANGRNRVVIGQNAKAQNAKAQNAKAKTPATAPT